ncbi:hypothetical protein FCOL_02525 [Flavobacterium columnare ATCC 49512]|uniref:HNH nuclease domain-containing protein n=1 Tax=Flavobacterium columnare (strain ATCC 49512 / CIP 103533 / TG 44/87) TaxID=1041826 RepID=G8X4C7_FLACA|nr:hypothetical protein [Flavobacterium columnare]AEW85352.1 hypothetical protein FCOL_02525 [Flavobacterium columnare ATCC 49512]
MISIRECISETELISIRNKHIDFVSTEVEKRIDFYINLFNYISFLQLHQRTRTSTIKNEVNKIIHPLQYEPFIKIIFNNEQKFDYNNLKKANLLKPKARNINNVVIALKKIKKENRVLLGLDLSYKGLANKRYYTISKLVYDPIDFLLKKIFDYENWFLNLDPDGVWGPYQLTESLGMKVCSYCNRQYTFSLSKGKNKITRPELDHFLPKNENPLLSLSFFNLIPSCTICNRDCKGKKSFSYQTHFSPYEANSKHELIKYDYYPKTYLGSIGETDEFRIFVKNDGAKLSPELKAKIDGNTKVFELNTIVNEHKDVVQEIIKKRHISNDNYIETLQKTFPGAKLTLEEAYRLAYGNFYDEKEFNKRPLAKLTKDIAVSIGSLKKYSK